MSKHAKDNRSFKILVKSALWTFLALALMVLGYFGAGYILS